MWTTWRQSSPSSVGFWRMFETALAITLREEGGYSNHPDDDGGRTLKGVTERSWYDVANLWGVSTLFEDITDTDIRWFYEVGYWRKIGADEMPAPLAIVAFDCAVNHGRGIALKWLERTRDPVEMTEFRVDLWTNHKKWPVFGRGWARRGVRVLSAALALTDHVETLVLHQPGLEPLVLRQRAAVLKRGSKLDVRLDVPCLTALEAGAV